MYIHNETGCVHVSIQEGDFCIASRKGLQITITPPVSLVTDYFELCGYTCTVEESQKNTVLLLKDEKQYGGDFTSGLDPEWRHENVTEASTIEVTLFCEFDLDSTKANDLLCSAVSSLRQSYPLIFCPVQRSLLADLEVHCKNITESCCLLDIDVCEEDIWAAILSRQHQLLMDLSHKAWLRRTVNGVQILPAFRFVEDDSDLTQDESFEMTDYDAYEGVETEKLKHELTQVSDHMSLLTISCKSTTGTGTDILSDSSNESMTLLEEWDEGKSLESTDSLIVEQTFDTFVNDIYSDDDSCA